MSKIPEPTIEDYKKYTRELKAKIKRLQEKNKELAAENGLLKDGGPVRGEALKNKVEFAVTLSKKVVRAQVR